VAGSSAITRANGVDTLSVPSTISGVASNFVGWRVCVVSPVRYVHATSRFLTFSRVICARGENRLPSASYAVHSPRPATAAP
jgi:hypothetical protein